MAFNSIYVAATSQHVGKTTSTLGLVSAFRNKGINVGYCKPVGQKYVFHNGLQVDKDVVLFADLLDFKPDPAIHSPVILGAGATTEYLDHPENYQYADNIRSHITIRTVNITDTDTDAGLFILAGCTTV